MINEVRNTVMAILNKDNNGYITPSEFNLFAKQAQLELFEEYFYNYNNWLIKQNQGNGREIRLSNSGYADIPQSYEQVIDSFALFANCIFAIIQIDSATIWNGTDFVVGEIATQAVSGASGRVVSFDVYGAVKVLRLNTPIVGNFNTTNAITAPSGASLGAVVNPGEYIKVDSSADNFQLPADWYYINLIRYGGSTEVEKIHNNQQILAANSVLTAASTTYPTYVQQGNYLSVGPGSIINQITAHYVRYPKDPNWTYLALAPSDGDPIFDGSATDYQDFELPISDSTTLVFKILQYAGVNIREQEVTKFGEMEEVTENKIEG